MHYIFGLTLDISSDEIVPNLSLSIFPKKRGNCKGTPLEITDLTINDVTRTSISRVAAQLYDVTGAIIQPYIFGAKVFLSRACTIASLDEIDTPLAQLDKEFGLEALKFLNGLKEIKNINPHKRAIVPYRSKLKGFIASRDGGVPGFGTLVHAIHEDHNKKLDTTLMGAKSKVSRRSVFIHELLSITLSFDLISQLIDSLEFDHKEKDFEIISVGDSASVAALFNLGLTIKSTLARSQIDMIKNTIINIGLKFPNARIKLCWIPGDKNPADTVSKLFPNPLSICNSPFYRKGPQLFRDIAKVTEYTYLTYQKGEFTYTPLPDSVIGNKNTKDIESHVSVKESINVDPDKLFIDKMNLSKAEKRTDPSYNKTAVNTNDKVRVLIKNNIATLNHSPTLFMKWINSLNFGPLHSVEGLLDVTYSSKTSFSIELPEYEHILGKFYNIEAIIRIFGYLSLLRIAKTGLTRKLKEVCLAREGWYNLLRTSQRHFPPKMPKGVDPIECDGIKSVTYRLSYEKARLLFGSSLVGLMSIDDPLVVKIIREAHTVKTMAGQWDLSPHYGVTDTLARINSGPYGIMVSGIKKKLQSFVWGCKICQKQARRQFNPTLGTRETKTFIPQRVFSQVSIDPLGEILIRPFENSRTRSKLYPLVFLDPQIGYVHVELIPSLKSKHILIGILNLQATYATRVEYIISDAGTSLQSGALMNEMEDFNKGISDLCSGNSGIRIRNNSANSQYRNPVEASIKLLKKYVNMILDKTKSQNLPCLDPAELRLIMNLATHCINRRPYKNQDGLLSPIHFVLTSPIYHLIQLGTNANEVSLSYDNLQSYIKTFKDMRKNALIAESELYLKKRFKNSKNTDVNQIEIGDLVFIDYENKPNSYDFGVVTQIDRSEALVRFRDSKVETIPVRLLYALSQAKHSMNEGGKDALDES